MEQVFSLEDFISPPLLEFEVAEDVTIETGIIELPEPRLSGCLSLCDLLACLDQEVFYPDLRSMTPVINIILSLPKDAEKVEFLFRENQDFVHFHQFEHGGE